MIVYKITNTVNGKIYIGITAYTLQFRFRAHHNSVKRGSTMAIHHAMRKHGFENFTAEEIDRAVDYEELKRLEMGYIGIYNTMSRSVGYNMTVGGKGCHGFKHREESKEKMSKFHKGRPRTDAEKERTSRQFKGIPKSEDHRIKISQGNAGQPKSSAHREKLSAALLGRARPDIGGEKHGGSKLSDIQRYQIYGRYTFGTESQKAIAYSYGVVQQTIGKAIEYVRERLPQNVVTREAYEEYVSGLRPIDLESSEGIVSEIEDDCATGACPVR